MVKTPATTKQLLKFVNLRSQNFLFPTQSFCTLRKRPSFLQNAYEGWKHLSGQIPPTKRELIELQELRLAFQSIHARRLAEDFPNESHEEKLLEIWEESNLLQNVGMRYEVTVELVPEILELFETFQQVDKQLESSSLQFDTILFQDYEETCREQHTDSSKSNYFLSTKRGALEILLRYLDDNRSVGKELTMHDSSSNEKDWFENLDYFGYNGKDADIEVYKSIRDHQVYNMVRSFLIKQQLGYSVLALKSSIFEAGRGIFLDGVAPIGAILAFFPGQVWPREYLKYPSAELADYFTYSNNPNLQLHLRGDDFILDCRASPYTVLKDSNPWAISHIANHAPLDKANARSMMINIYEKMKLKESLRRYIPNEYAKPPTFMGGAMLDRERIEMHGMCLMNRRRELVNEEIFFDYRLLVDADEETRAIAPKWYRDKEYDLTGMNE